MANLASNELSTGRNYRKLAAYLRNEVYARNEQRDNDDCRLSAFETPTRSNQRV